MRLIHASICLYMHCYFKSCFTWVWCCKVIKITVEKKFQTGLYALYTVLDAPSYAITFKAKVALPFLIPNSRPALQYQLYYQLKNYNIPLSNILGSPSIITLYRPGEHLSILFIRLTFYGITVHYGIL